MIIGGRRVVVSFNKGNKTKRDEIIFSERFFILERCFGHDPFQLIDKFDRKIRSTVGFRNKILASIDN